ncbi:MAG: amidohydrolase family protein [Clostridia bacterium]|nr:amidohydrolase family protein [Clostridia bacterium]
MNSWYEPIFEYVQSLQIIDSHEHLAAWEHKRDKDTDILKEYLVHYFSSDLVTAGMSYAEVQALRDPTKPLMERWKAAEPYWKLARNTAYGRALDTTVKALYGAERIDGNTLEGINEAFLKTLEPTSNHYDKILKDMSGIEFSVLDEYPHVDPRYFRAAFNLDRLFCPDSWEHMEEVEQESGVPINSLDGWIDACETYLRQMLDMGIHILKCHAAYFRPLLFENVSYKEADECYCRMLDQKGRSAWNPGVLQIPKAFQDFMMHRVMRFANEHGMTCQIHTGLQESGNNYIAYADPSQLSNLFVQYPFVRFDLFHIGYPYQHVMSALGKMFPNVYLDMCWAHIISPAACMAALDDWLDAVPANKVIAFGGDYQIIDAVYAHQLMARQNVSKVLAKKVEDGVFGLDEAKWLAQRMFYDNPKAIFER